MMGKPHEKDYELNSIIRYNKAKDNTSNQGKLFLPNQPIGLRGGIHSEYSEDPQELSENTGKHNFSLPSFYKLLIQLFSRINFVKLNISNFEVFGRHQNLCLNSLKYL